MKHTGGRWNPKDWPIYFIAANFDRLKYASPVAQNLLVAVNEMMTEGGGEDVKKTEADLVRKWVGQGKSVLVDSGVYWLATQHAEKHGLSMDQALSMEPHQVDNFEHLLKNYVRVMSEFGDQSWGYIEIDQGGRDNKIKTRTKLEAMGLRPIPVYHPLNDGWDYFDELAQNYDRICFGNVVRANAIQRKRLIATAWERRRKYPHLWIHALGMTPSDITTAFPMNSCDSSTWMGGFRWGVHRTLTANTGAQDLPDGFIYNRSVDREHEKGNIKATKLCVYDATIIGRTMKVIADEQREQIGADIGLFV